LIISVNNLGGSWAVNPRIPVGKVGFSD
jgi:hypothetical protein